MKKTPAGVACDARLTEINDQLCFGAFSTIELSRIIAALNHPPETLASIAFPQNPHAPRIDRRLEDLPEFQGQAIRTLNASALIAASEYVQAFFRSSSTTVHRLTGTASPLKQGGEDEKLRDQLVALGAPVVPEIFDTVIYLRLRRNRLVHEGPLGQWLDDFFDAGVGNRVKAYWGTRRTKLFGFDFLDRDLGRFTINDGYAVMNLLRICMKTIDGWVAAQLPVAKLADEVARDLISRYPGLRNEIPTLTKRTRRELESLYGTKVALAEIDGPVRKARAI